MTFITLLEAVIIIYLAVYNIRIIRKMDRLKKQLRSSSPDKPNLKRNFGYSSTCYPRDGTGE